MLPVVSGKKLISFLTKLGYRVVRRRGSHVQLKCDTKNGSHSITVPMHNEIAKGTLNDILNSVSLWLNMSKDELLTQMKKA